MADKHPTLPALCGTVLAASVLMALVPFVADPFLSLSVDAFDTYSLGGFAGSLFGVLVLVAVPVLMLGTVSPWAIRLKMHAVEDSGETAGRMYAISTVGSLLGTFMSSLLLIPLVGTQRTFLTFALITAAVAALGLRRRYLLVPLAIAALIALPVGITKASDKGDVIYEADTEYQYARVVELDDGERHLELNEGLAVHSVYRPDTVLTDNVWDGYLIEPFAVLDQPARADRDPRQRRRHDRPRVRALLPRHADRRRRDRRRAARDRQALLRPARTAAAVADHRGRAAVPAPERRRLRRDLRRRLPPAVHPVLHGHVGVLRARARPARARRRRDRQRRPPGGVGQAREGPVGDRRRRVPVRAARPARGRQHAARRVRDRAERGEPAGGRPGAPRTTCGRWPSRPRRGWSRRSRAATSTPTTTRRSSG